MMRVEYQDMEGRLHAERFISAEYMHTYIKYILDNNHIFILPINNVRWVKETRINEEEN